MMGTAERTKPVSGWILRCAVRVSRAAQFALELVRLPGDRWLGARSASVALQVAVDSVQPVFDAVFAIWGLARELPPVGRDRVYAVTGQAGQVVVAHAESASMVARSGGPVLLLVDALGKAVWRIDTDKVWRDDLDLIFRELFEVSQGRSAIDETGIPAMPRLPWHRD